MIEKSELARRLRPIVARYPGPKGTNVKIAEQPGPPILRSIVRNNPFPRASCNRHYCPIQLSGEDCREDCSSEGVLYAASCHKCHIDQVDKNIKELVEQIYTAETSCTIMTRSLEHREGYRKCSQSRDNEHSSFMYDHYMEAHIAMVIDRNNDFTFRIISKHRDAMDRQISELKSSRP